MTAKDKAAIEGIENLRLEDEAALEGQDLISAEPHQRLPSSSLTALTEVDGQYVIVPLHGNRMIIVRSLILVMKNK